MALLTNQSGPYRVYFADTAADVPDSPNEKDWLIQEDTGNIMRYLGGTWRTFIDSSMLDTDATLAGNSDVKVATQKAVKTAMNKKTGVRFWDAGTFQNGTPTTGEMVVFTDNATIAGGSGNTTFYLTSDHTSSGSALCSSILVNSVRGSWVDATGNFNPGQPTVTSNKTVVVPTTKQSATGITLLSTTVIGSVTYPAAPNGTVVTLFAIGISV